MSSQMNRSDIRVLLVEDNPGDVRLVREMFAEIEAHEFDLAFATRLDQALDRIGSENFDILILDLSLPDAQGMQTLKRVQAVAPTLPIVVLSGTNNETLALEAVQAGAQDYLVKGQGDGNLLTRALRYAIERKRTEERLTYLAQYDPLTGLPNRVLFRDRLSQTLHHTQREQMSAALMFLDLDHFKDINDTLGHDAGDELLKAVATRLQSCIREEDTIARLGGDEFTIILHDISHQEDAVNVARKVIEQLSQPFLLEGQEVFVTTSMGIASYPKCGENPEKLIRNADTALYRAKSEGRANYQFYETEMNIAVSERMAMINNLRHAIQREEFLVYYQPLLDALTGEVTGVEALLRWRHPDLGLIESDQFVPLLEETGLIIPVGEWVLRTACHQSRDWQAAGLPPTRMAVNLSARQFRQHGMVDTVVKILADTGLAPEYLQLEITESVLIDRAADAADAIRTLHDIGIKLAIDDFGTGYSSLSYLKQFPFDTLKFDRTFIKDISSDADSVAIVAAVILLGQSLRLEVVAEGVETQGQLALLHEHGCDRIQGYLFSRPMPASACEQFLRKPATANWSWNTTSASVK